MTPPVRLLAWDGLRLFAPTDLEPARLGRGYMLLEDRRGPRLELRWRNVAPGFCPARALSRARLVRAREPGPRAAAALALLADGDRAWACAPKADPNRECLLVLLSSRRVAVVVGFFSGPDEIAPSQPDVSDRAVASAVASLDDSRPETVNLYDIALRVPRAMALADFSFRLGHFRLLYRGEGQSLEFARLAPAKAVLRGQGLDAWAGSALAAWAGRAQAWRVDAFAGGPAARLFPPPTVRTWWSRLAARLAPARTPGHGLAWLGDASRILAVRAWGGRGLSPQAFDAICREYVVSP